MRTVSVVGKLVRTRPAASKELGRPPSTFLRVSKIVTVAAGKGGVGKTTLAYELAYLLDAPLVDLDWNRGSSTRRWGFRPEARVRAPLIDAVTSGQTPALVAGKGRKPDLLPGHPDFAEHQPPDEEMADLLAKWAGEWGHDFTVVDTHPGAASAGHGAMAAANVVVVPVVLATNELNALEETLEDVPDYPLLLVPNMVERSVPRAELKRLRRMVEDSQTQVGPVVPLYRPLRTRKRHAALCAEQPTPVAARNFVAGLRQVADAVRSYTSG